MAHNHRLLPIYTTGGNIGAYLRYPYIFNILGEWIGWVSSNQEVFSVHGHYVGRITRDPRIIRKRSKDYLHARYSAPPPPRSIRPPATVPLPPLMPELSFSEIDVLEEQPDLLPTMDHGELREDMD